MKPAANRTAADPSGGDAAVITLLSKLVEKVDAMSTSHATVIQSSEQMRKQLVSHEAQMKKQHTELEQLRAQRQKQVFHPTKQVADSSVLPASLSVPSVPDSSHKIKFYAVAKGRQVDIFTTWKETERSVRGFSGAIHKRFRSEKAAAQWLVDHNVGRMDDTLDLSYDGTMQDATVYGDVMRGGTDISPKPPIIESLSGPDPSVGKPMELYNTSIQVEPAVLKILCPKGVMVQTRKDMMDAMPDIVSLPGKLGTAMSNSTEVWDQFAGAVSEIAEQRATRAETQPRDTQWKVSSRNALDKIRTMEDVFDAAEEIGS
jgi:hypothetical protein